MTNTENTTDTDTAKDALNTIQEASKAGIRAAMPPRWFGLAISLVTGSMVAATAAGETELIAISLAGLAIVSAMRKRTAVAEPRILPNSFVGVIAMVGLLLSALGLIAGGRVLMETQGMSWAPITSGAIFALVVYFLSLSERRDYRAHIEGKPDQ